MSRVTMIQHINIQISDKDRSRDWYEKVLGTEFLDRGPELNQRQLQLRIGNGEIHSTFTPNPNPSGHFAVEIHDWEEMIANLDALGVPYSKHSTREYSGGHSTYINDPDGNMIELVQHPGLQGQQSGGRPRSGRHGVGQEARLRPGHRLRPAPTYRYHISTEKEQACLITCTSPSRGTTRYRYSPSTPTPAG